MIDRGARGSGGVESRGEVRLNRYLAQCGLGSRRRCDALIESGNVRVNGQTVTQLGTKIDPSRDTVEFGKKEVRRAAPLQYFVMYKPRDCVVTRSDPEGRETIYDVLAARGFDAQHLNYVGRLDRNSEGVLLLTNDGALIHALTHPRYRIKKIYRVRIDRALGAADAALMVTEGVSSEGDLLRAGEIAPAPVDEAKHRGEHWYDIVLFEGKNRQIRRMFDALTYRVERLRRIQFGSVKIAGLTRGQFRPLTEREIKALLNAGYKTGSVRPRRPLH